MSSLLDTLKQVVLQLEAFEKAGGVLPPVTGGIGVTPAIPKIEYKYDAQNLLIQPAPLTVKNQRVDPIVDSFCETAVLVPSGKFLSKPRPDLGEMFMGYCMRVCLQGGKDPAQFAAELGSLLTAVGPLFAQVGGFKEDGSNWAQAADLLFNGRPMTEAEKAKAEADRLAAEKAWDEHWKQKQDAWANQNKSDDPPKVDTPNTGDGDVPISQG
jgi:hypothetical protein